MKCFCRRFSYDILQSAMILPAFPPAICSNLFEDVEDRRVCLLKMSRQQLELGDMLAVDVAKETVLYRECTWCWLSAEAEDDAKRELHLGTVLNVAALRAALGTPLNKNIATKGH